MTENPSPSGGYGDWNQPPQQPGYQPGYQQGYPPVGGPTTSEDRTWALAAHIGSIVMAWVALGLIAPLIVLLVRGKESPFVRRHAVESLNFQINALVLTVVFALLMFVLIGFVLLPLYGIFYLVFVIMGTVKASQGEEFRYPLTLRVIT